MKTAERERRVQRGVFPALLLAVFALAALYLVEVSLGSPSNTVHELFDLNGEGNIPTWFSSAILLLAATAFLLASGGQGRVPEIPARLFLLLGLAFLFLSLDEAVQIHERITAVVKQWGGVSLFSGDHGVWIPLYLCGAVLFGIAVLRQLPQAWKWNRRGITAIGSGLALMLAGGVVLEAISYGVSPRTTENPVFFIMVAAEEVLEMCGAILVLYGAVLAVSASYERAGK